MDIIDQLDDEINKIEYDVMLPALPQSLNDIIESAQHEPEVTSGISNAPVVIDADFGTGGMEDIDDIVDAINMLADDMIDNLGLVGTTMANGFAKEARDAKRTNDLLKSINTILTDQWEQNQKDRMFAGRRITSDGFDERGRSGKGGAGAMAASGADGGLDFDFGGPDWFNRDKDKEDARKQNRKTNTKTPNKGGRFQWLRKLGTPGKALAALGATFALSEATGFSNVTGIFGDDKEEAMQPQSTVANKEESFFYNDWFDDDPDSVATSNVTNNSAMNFEGDSFADASSSVITPAQTARERIYELKKDKLQQLRENHYSSVESSSAKINSEISNLQTAVATQNPTVSSDDLMGLDMGTSALAATALLGAPLLMRNPVSKIYPEMADYRTALPNRNLPTYNQPRLPAPVTATAQGLPAPKPKLGIPKAGLGRLLGPAATLGLGALDFHSIYTDENLTDDQKREAYGDVTGQTVSGLGGAAAGAALGTMIFPGVGTVIGGLLGGVGGSMLDSFMSEDGESSFIGDIINSFTGDSPDGEESFFDKMSIASAFGPLGMLADMTGATDTIADFFGFGDSDTKDQPKPEVTQATNMAPTPAKTDTVPQTAPPVSAKTDSPYIKTLSKAIPFYAKNHGKDASKTSDILNIYRMPNTSQGMANAMAKDILGEDFTAEIAIEEYQNALAAVNNADSVNVESNVDTVMGDINTASNVDISNASSSSSIESVSPNVAMATNTPTTERVTEEVQRESYATVQPQPDVNINLDRAADKKQTPPEKMQVAKTAPKTRIVKQPVPVPLSMGNISNLDGAGGINHINKSIG